MHAKSIVHHENMTVRELASADSNCRCSDFFCDFCAEFFRDVLKDHFEASETIDELCSLFDGARFFFCSAFLLEVFCGLR